MIPYLFHIVGPLYANCYGIAIFCAIIVLMYMALRDKKLMTLLTKDQLLNILFFGIIIGVLGGRLLWAILYWQHLNNWFEIVAIWDGGFSILGTILGILIAAPLFIKNQKLAAIPILDRLALYAPLAQSIARLGCLFAGCCYGACTTLWCGITYSHPASAAPLGIKIHPTQVYSSLFLLGIFLLMYFFIQYRVVKKGELILIYLMLSCFERFSIDFLRADRDFFGPSPWHNLSINQWIALAIFIVAFLVFLYNRYYTKGKNV